MKVLHLTLKKKWFDMVLSGEKKEEYRERKEYWETRLVALRNASKVITNDGMPWRYLQQDDTDFFKKYDIVTFTNGYGNNAPAFDIELKGIEIGVGKKEWGAPYEPVFILNLGNVISTRNIK